MTHYFKWDEAKTAQVIDLHEAGLEPAAISRAIGISEKRIAYRLKYLEIRPAKPHQKSDIDLAQQMHELARLRFSIDESASVMDISLSKALDLAEYYCVKFDGIPVDMATVKAMLEGRRSHSEIAAIFGCSHQKIAAIAKAMNR